MVHCVRRTCRLCVISSSLRSSYADKPPPRPPTQPLPTPPPPVTSFTSNDLQPQSPAVAATPVAYTPEQTAELNAEYNECMNRCQLWSIDGYKFTAVGSVIGMFVGNFMPGTFASARRLMPVMAGGLSGIVGDWTTCKRQCQRQVYAEHDIQPTTTAIKAADQSSAH